MNTSFLKYTFICFFGLVCAATSGCAPDKDSASETETASETESASETETGSETEMGSETDSDTGPEQSMPNQGFWGFTRTYDDTNGSTDPVSIEICAATAEQLADIENPPVPEDMICVTSSADGSYALELEAGTYGLCVVTCEFSCILEITEGLVVKRDWEAGPGGGIFEPTCPSG